MSSRLPLTGAFTHFSKSPVRACFLSLFLAKAQAGSRTMSRTGIPLHISQAKAVQAGLHQSGKHSCIAASLSTLGIGACYNAVTSSAEDALRKSAMSPICFYYRMHMTANMCIELQKSAAAAVAQAVIRRLHYSQAYPEVTSAMQSPCRTS